MYLSKLLLDPASRQVQAEISNRYELHRTLTAQFPHKTRKEIGMLYRIELLDQHRYQPITLLIQTQIEPHWNSLVESGLVIHRPQIKTFEPTFDEGRNFYFRLLGNPTIRRKHPDGKSKRVGLYTGEAQQDWIMKKAERSGFKVQTLKITDLGMIESVKRKNNQTFTIKHIGVQFDGVLAITDSHQFEENLTNGIGSAKAFGFGLLSLVNYAT